MIEVLLATIMISLWLLLRPLRDYYVVEVRRCSSVATFPWAFDQQLVVGRAALRARGCKLLVRKRYCGTSVLYIGRTTGLSPDMQPSIQITCTAYEDAHGAIREAEGLRAEFERMDATKSDAGAVAANIVVLRVIARTRGGALAPPSSARAILGRRDPVAIFPHGGTYFLIGLSA